MTGSDPVSARPLSLPGSRNQFRDWKSQGSRTLAMRHAIMQSCDVFFYTVASKLGIDRMHRFS